MYIRSSKLHFVKVGSRTSTNIRCQYIQHEQTKIKCKWGSKIILSSPGMIIVTQVRSTALVSVLSVDLKSILSRHLCVNIPHSNSLDS